MSIASAIVLFLVIWFMTFLIALPIRIQTQGEAGTTVDGTHAGSPEQHHLRKKVIITTLISIVLWIIIGGTILSGVISVRDIDMFGRMGADSALSE
jgi:predicted secreted protein